MFPIYARIRSHWFKHITTLIICSLFVVSWNHWLKPKWILHLATSSPWPGRAGADVLAKGKVAIPSFREPSVRAAFVRWSGAAFSHTPPGRGSVGAPRGILVYKDVLLGCLSSTASSPGSITGGGLLGTRSLRLTLLSCPQSLPSACSRDSQRIEPLTQLDEFSRSLYNPLRQSKV